jgi:hypothetical protein
VIGAIKQAKIKKSAGERLRISSCFSLTSDWVVLDLDMREKKSIKRTIKNIAVHIQIFLLLFFLKEEVISFHCLGITQRAQIRKGNCETKSCQKCSKISAFI